MTQTKQYHQNQPPPSILVTLASEKYHKLVAAAV